MLTKILRNFASQIFGLLVSIGDRFLLTAILLRMWSTDLFADWTTLTAWSSLLGLADLGFVIFVGNRLQKAFSLGDDAGFQRQVGAGAFIYGAIGVMMLAAAAGGAALESVSPFLALRVLAPADASRTLLLLGTMQILHTSKSAFSTIYRGRGDFARGVLVDGVSALCIVCVALIAALAGAGPHVLALAYIASHLLFGWGVLLGDLRRRYPDLSFRPLPPTAAELRDAALSMRWYALTYALPTVWLQAPVLLLSALGLGGTVVVSFVLHRTLVNFGRTFVVMLSTSAGVELAPHVHAVNTAVIERGMAFAGRSVAAIGGAMAAGLLVFGARIVGLWTGKPDLFDMATQFWLVLPALVVAPAIPLLYLAHLADLPKQLATVQLMQTLIAVALAVPLAGAYGAAGVAFAFAAGEIASVGVLLPALLTKRLGIGYWRHAAQSLCIALAALAWSALVGWGIASWIGVTSLGALGGCFAMWAVAALVPIAYLLVPAAQQARLRQSAGAFRGKRKKEA